MTHNDEHDNTIFQLLIVIHGRKLEEVHKTIADNRQVVSEVSNLEKGKRKKRLLRL